jgi:gas vesicle protein
MIMKYEKMLSNCVSKDSDSSNAIVALLTGLAVGAVLGVLFAPSSGEETRSLISEKATDLTGDLKERYNTVKEKIVTGKDDLVDLKDRVTETVKTKAGDLKQEFKDYKDEALGTAKNDIKEASDDLNDSVQNA